ncbi:acetolactate synthase small subunit [Sporanaerobium hydrogeniformans]|uniref:Acetolactate synthase small subunit n=1 Tax=Sporanaerobium hydrogeniformans TaxID=3072179 RepID=A0AC61DGC4_9FIRM|nr:acetolactate synthase small subunit [Sporanaerobium hydrogeniformans]PHV72027.1 acetolactate synthase small subunit [Sporanaerobium hydrogeniformans]
MKNSILSVLVENNYGVVARIAGLFTRRGFNMNSFAGEETHDSNISRITISITENEDSIDQIQKQVEKLVDIKKVERLDVKKDIIRELALIKVRSQETLLPRIKDLTDAFNVKVIDMDTQVVVFEICNTKEKLDAFIDTVREYEIIESVRTGVIALQRGNKHI